MLLLSLDAFEFFIEHYLLPQYPFFFLKCLHQLLHARKVLLFAGAQLMLVLLQRPLISLLELLGCIILERFHFLLQPGDLVLPPDALYIELLIGSLLML